MTYEEALELSKTKEFQVRANVVEHAANELCDAWNWLQRKYPEPDNTNWHWGFTVDGTIGPCVVDDFDY